MIVSLWTGRCSVCWLARFRRQSPSDGRRISRVTAADCLARRRNLRSLRCHGDQNSENYKFSSSWAVCGSNERMRLFPVVRMWTFRRSNRIEWSRCCSVRCAQQNLGVIEIASTWARFSSACVLIEQNFARPTCLISYPRPALRALYLSCKISSARQVVRYSCNSRLNHFCELRDRSPSRSSTGSAPHDSMRECSSFNFQRSFIQQLKQASCFAFKLFHLRSEVTWIRICATESSHED